MGERYAGLTLLGDYIGTTLKNPVNMPGSPHGWAVQLTNGTGINSNFYFSNLPITNPKKVGDSAWLVGYHQVQAGTTPSGASGFDVLSPAYIVNQPFSVFLKGTDNIKGWIYSYEFVPAKNVTFNVAYESLKILNRGLTTLTSNDLNKSFTAILNFWF